MTTEINPIKNSIEDYSAVDEYLKNTATRSVDKKVKSSEADFKNEIGNAVEKMENAEANFISAIKKGEEKEIMLARIQYDKATRILSSINEFIKNKGTMMLNIIHSMRLG